MLRNKKGQFQKGNKGFWLGKKRTNMLGENNYKWVGKKNDRICKVCRTKFRRSNTSKGNIPKFCSAKCMGISMRGGWIKEKNPRWNGGTTKKWAKIRSHPLYKEWRMKVLQRDRFSCVICGHRSKQSFAHGDGKCDIRVDHIKPFSLYPKLRFKISNGRTLCVPCDRKYGWNPNRKCPKQISQEPSETIRSPLQNEVKI